ncbi:2-amino-3,7-dideoxy-D-threo-hept-6-ulosonate synthase [Halovenus aranensis]|uniref:2-amino-3,7-dideoxy-D-threo-hept-6-ulosonate synthase n=1 Tax=Halovenus aranensis TaxID=890420 RepID=A0A1G8W4W4_9EURY|nr:2-amino-3,7-dideoxy-D-threo-hept-6-ulosonate synthase [Halovenus aranensis]SDJ73371.1 2-amino-3,7-dideoxy-D-threo-hept-6-ulosonate synthase [Halovenus aranensis]
MNTGVQARLDRISEDGRYLVIPMDHGITMGAVDGLADIESTIDGVTSGGATAVLTQKGIAPRVHDHKNGAGYVVHLNGSTTLGPDENDKRITGTVEDAIRVGADAVSVHINVGSTYEREQIADLGEITTKAAEYGMPVLAMTYARGPDVSDKSDPTAYAEDVAHAVRLGEELGADVVKTSYTGTPESFERVVEATRLPVVIAGGSKGTDRETLETVAGAMDAGAAGVSTGRSVFQHQNPRAITDGIAAVVRDGVDPEAAAKEAGLTAEA